MVEVRQVHADTDHSRQQTHKGGLYEMGNLMITNGLHQIGDNHKEEDKQIIVGHLHVVGTHLEGGEDSRNHKSPQVFPTIGQYHTGNHRRQVGQRHHFPEVSCGDDYQEIGRESPDDGSQGGQQLSEVEGPQQDIEAQQIGKQVPYVVGQPQMICVDGGLYDITTLIRGCYLVGRHTSKHGVGPTRHLPCTLIILRLLVSQSLSC